MVEVHGSPTEHSGERTHIGSSMVDQGSLWTRESAPQRQPSAVSGVVPVLSLNFRDK